MEKRKTVKTRIKKKIEQRLTDYLRENTKTRTIQKDRQLVIECIRNGNTDDIKDILKIRLHMWDVKKKYSKNDKNTICPICKNKGDTTEHVLDCEVELEKRQHTIGSSNINQ